MEYDFSAFSGDNAAMGGMDSMGSMGGTGGFSGGISGGTNSFGGGTGGLSGGMGGGTNSFGGGTGGMGEGMGAADMEEFFGQSPWGGLGAVGFTSLEQVFRGSAGGNLQGGGGEQNDPLTGEGGYTYNFSAFE